jgi:hypothetical protein
MWDSPKKKPAKHVVQSFSSVKEPSHVKDAELAATNVQMQLLARSALERTRA